MRIAARTTNLGAFHEERVVSPSSDILGRDRLPKARPSSARIEFGCRAKQRRSAADTSVNPVRAQFVVLVAVKILFVIRTDWVVAVGTTFMRGAEQDCGREHAAPEPPTVLRALRK